MTLGLAILLGILQGFTEFLPVSSSGHLALFGNWFGLSEPDITFDILVHIATLAAIVAYFYKDWLQLASSAFKREQGDMPRLILPHLIVSMIPAGLIGFTLKDQFEVVHHHNAWIGAFLLVTGVTLLVGLRCKEGTRNLRDMTWAIVIVMALAQAIAILPGISRSGSTIMAAVFMGMRRTDAARFSFLMAVPVIGGAGLLAVKDLLENSAAISTDLLIAYSAGFLAALVSGFVALAFMMRLLEARRFFYFGFYCIALGLLAMIF